MSETEKDELIDAQKQVIGILFEVIKRLQSNSDLDEEYFEIITKKENNETRLNEILLMKERRMQKSWVDY